MPDWRRHVAAALGDEPLDPARLADVSREFADHLDDRYHALLAEGIRPDEAERMALTELQSGTLREELRRVVDSPTSSSRDPILGAPSAGGWLSSVGRDLRYGLRHLRSSPGFTVAALVCLALGIGAYTAIFELLDAVRMRTLPVKDPGALAAVRIVSDSGRVGHFRGARELTTRLFEAVRAQQQGFGDIAAWSVDVVDLSRSDEVHHGRALLADGRLFGVLGVSSVLGRLIAPTDDQLGCGAPPAVVSYGFWQHDMGGRASAIGERIWINRRAFEVVGVTAPTFFGLEVGHRVDVALPLCAQPLIEPEDRLADNPIGWWLGAVGRVKEGWNVRRASDQLSAISPAVMRATVPPPYNAAQRNQYARLTLGAVPIATGYSRLRATYDRPFWLLLGIAAVVLLIACANLANLMLARAAVREREMAVRLALGASRARLFRQLLAENGVLSVLGAIAGALVAHVLSGALVPLLGGRAEQIFIDLHTDWRVLAFTAGLALITCLLFGLTPALRASQIAPVEAAKTSGRGIVASRSGATVRRVLVTAQIALCLTLVMGALLFVRTFRNLVNVSAGFNADGVVVADVDFSHMNIPAAQRLLYRQQLTALVARVPRVDTVARSSFEPVNGGAWNEEINIPSAGTIKQVAWFDEISPGYFGALQNALIAGRDFNNRDTLGSPKVAIVSRTFATRLFHEDAPLGRTFGVGQYGDKPDVLYEVVGIAEDLKYRDLRSDFEPIVYLPDTQAVRQQTETTLLIRSRQRADILIPEIRRALVQDNSGLLVQFSRLTDDVADGLVAERLMAMLAGFFGVLAIVLAAVGLYGVIAYTVARRTNEIGIRMALGAGGGRILLLVLKEVTVICAIGVLAGVALTVGAGPAVQSLLFRLRPADPATVATAVAAVVLVTLIASLLPALRAAMMEPLDALRSE
jgi:putative ABC transport system permease protein